MLRYMVIFFAPFLNNRDVIATKKVCILFTVVPTLQFYSFYSDENSFYFPVFLVLSYLESRWFDGYQIVIGKRYKPPQTNVKGNPPNKKY